jgi:site-specific DNA recombinase
MCLTLVNSMRSQGWEVVDAKFDDIAESSETLNRPAMQRLLDEIAHQRIDRVIVTRLDRISRRLQDTCEFMEYLRSSNVAITIASQPEIGGDAQGRLLINLMASFAEFEQDMTRSRMEEARAALKHHGRRVAGRVAYGFSADPINKQLVPCAPACEQIKAFYQWAADGVLPSDIAVRANERGWHKQQETATATLWTARRIIALLNNRHYIGDIRYGDEWIPGQHQPLIDLELYNQARLKIASRRNERKSKVSVPQNRFLKRLILCPNCGRRLSVSSKSRQRKSGATILFSDYCCRSTSGGLPPCQGVRFTATLLEDDVMKAIKLLSESNAELAKHWNKLDLRQQRLLVPRIVESVSIDAVRETITVKLKSDALEFLD